jgi:hypothetical protein
MSKRRFVDLSIYLENDVISDPAPFGPNGTGSEITSFSR